MDSRILSMDSKTFLKNEFNTYKRAFYENMDTMAIKVASSQTSLETSLVRQFTERQLHISSYLDFVKLQLAELVNHLKELGDAKKWEETRSEKSQAGQGKTSSEHSGTLVDDKPAKTSTVLRICPVLLFSSDFTTEPMSTAGLHVSKSVHAGFYVIISVHVSISDRSSRFFQFRLLQLILFRAPAGSATPADPSSRTSRLLTLDLLFFFASDLFQISLFSDPDFSSIIPALLLNLYTT
ncbi:transducin family protein [Dorcoceras hygrometricum]|uniref:Transducin family protein n=1 Tax=Dorcoceras hygrometricum TaxID=472368 RepID=A0A2Z7B1V9_9LAMI|nr:transducin family protein [Dorcoceras hygrometricum]